MQTYSTNLAHAAAPEPSCSAGINTMQATPHIDNSNCHGMLPCCLFAPMSCCAQAVEGLEGMEAGKEEKDSCSADRKELMSAVSVGSAGVLST